MRLRKERDPRFVERRSWWSTGYRLYVGRDRSLRCFQFSRREFEHLVAELRQRGIAEVAHEGRERLWWTGREELFWADDGLQRDEVELLVWDRRRRREGRLDRLRRIRAREDAAATARRERIPPEVREFVWRRDGGRCVQCGAETDLQFDHIIPHAKGGGVGAENIQVLCGDCNRVKGDSIG